MRAAYSLLTLCSLLLLGLAAVAESVSFDKPEGTYNVSASLGNKDQEFLSKIIFTPKSSFSCKSFGFIQAKRVHDLRNNDFIWTKKSGLNKLNFLKTKDNWFVNHSPNRCAKGSVCLPYVDSWKPTPKEPGLITITESNEDALPIGQVEAESCLVCKETSQILSCIQYTQAITPEKKVTIAASESPTSFFSDSLASFFSFYKK